MNSAFRIERRLLRGIHDDLSRRHAHAHERVGFIACCTTNVVNGIVLLAQEYLPVADEDYVINPHVGATMSAAAIRKALEYAYNHKVSMLHVHRHEHRGKPAFSRVDSTENAKFIPNFWHVRPERPHGALVLSHNSMSGMCWDPASGRPSEIKELTVVGGPLSIFGGWWK